ncbi:hypothetical protein COV17_01600 [Candidatus Woesearchaeota archaeon CG10_big_fil_rev_8_21_14_0_10_36_11]|nr:MAG: hypothetical protein COV17_01600 [Candidatus Woesearchaeota archaeon CG10_big_fil_rev_8_21_14_0_10_36_11]
MVEITVHIDGGNSHFNINDFYAVARVSEKVQQGADISLLDFEKRLVQVLAVEYLHTSLSLPYSQRVSEKGIAIGLHFWNIASIFCDDGDTPVEDMLRDEIGWDSFGPKILGEEREQLCSHIVRFLYKGNVDSTYYKVIPPTSIALRHILRRGPSPGKEWESEQNYNAGVHEASTRLYGVHSNERIFGGGAPYAPRITVWDKNIDRGGDIILVPSTLPATARRIEKDSLQIRGFSFREQGKLNVVMQNLRQESRRGTLDVRYYTQIRQYLETILCATPHRMLYQP